MAKVRMLGEPTTFFLLFSEELHFRFNAFEEYKGGYEIEYFPGFSTKFEFARKDMYSVGDVLFKRTASDGSTYDINRLSTAQINFSARFAYREKFISGDLDRN